MEEPHNAVWNPDLPLPCQTADTEYLAFFNGETGIVNQFSGHIHPQVLNVKNRFIKLPRRLLHALAVYLSSNHRRCNGLHIRLRGLRILNGNTVAQHNHAIADFHNFVQTVRNKNNRNPFFRQCFNGL